MLTGGEGRGGDERVLLFEALERAGGEPPASPQDVEGVLALCDDMRRLARLNRLLERRVERRTRQLEAARLEVLEQLALVTQLRDDGVGEHNRRVGRLAARLAAALGLAAPEAELIGRAAVLHDVGKVGIPDAILRKPGRLTARELAVMRRHPRIGADILARGHSPLARIASDIALTHHERWDGGGYPQGLRGEASPLAGRLVAVADAWDVMTHARPYRRPRPPAAARAELERERGAQFDPRVVEAFLALEGTLWQRT